MSLERFMTSRLVVQSPDTRIYDAVRAMEDNAVGAVLVHDGQGLVGIVTDRDLSLKVIGGDLDAFEFKLEDVMSSPVASVRSTARVEELSELMIERRVRRVPIVDGPAILGIVTLDDLILEHAVDAGTQAAIVRGQLAEPRRLKARGDLHPTAPVRGTRAAVQQGVQRRHEARRRNVYAKLIKRALGLTELDSAEQAERVLLIVVSAVLRRVTQQEATAFVAQLPRSLREYAIANVPSGPDVSVHREDIERQVALALDVGLERAAQIVRQIGAALRASISDGELSDMMSQLPRDMLEIFEPSSL